MYQLEPCKRNKFSPTTLTMFWQRFDLFLELGRGKTCDLIPWSNLKHTITRCQTRLPYTNHETNLSFKPAQNFNILYKYIWVGYEEILSERGFLKQLQDTFTTPMGLVISEFAGGKMTISLGIITEPNRCDVFFSRLTEPHSNKLPVCFFVKTSPIEMTRRNTSHTHCSSFDYLYGWLLPPQIDHLPAPPQILNPKMHKSFNLPGIPRKWSQQLLPASFLFLSDEDRQVGVSSPCRLWKFRFSSGSGIWWLLGDENHLLRTLALAVRLKEHFGTAVMMMTMMRITSQTKHLRFTKVH